MKKMKTRILLLLAVLLVSAVGAKAENVLYGIMSGTSLTIYYGEAPAGAFTYDETNGLNDGVHGSSITSATFDASCASYNGTTLKLFFVGYSSLTTINGLENLNTSSVTDMEYMFENCPSLTSLDLRSWDTSNVENMNEMFKDCTDLATLYVGNWNTAKVTNMRKMFLNCKSLVSLDLSGWNTAKVENMYDMFGCPSYTSSLVTIYVGDGWSTASVTEGGHMFYNCTELVGEDGSKCPGDYNYNVSYAHFNAGGYLRNNYLYDAVSSEEHLSDWNGKTFGAVKISGRTLKAGHWNTLYLPFALDADQIAASFPAGTEVKTFNSYSNDGTILTLGFTDAAAMEAGYPYIVHIPAGENITDPVFRNVVIKPEYNGVKKGDATFAGIYNPMDIGATRYRLFLQNDLFYYPTADVDLNGFRGYFVLSTTPAPESASAKIIIDWGDGETTGIANTDFADETDGEWYTLQGVKLDGKPVEKGIYIINGKKVAVQ